MPESVWDYPRPPRLEPVRQRIRLEHAGVIVAETTRALRVCETASPPTYYVPPDDVRRDLLTPTRRTSWCEFKGGARYWTLTVGGETVQNAAWSYPEPAAPYGALRDHLAFYAGRVDACWVGEERVEAQAGDFYGGWITADLLGPFKGEPGTESW